MKLLHCAVYLATIGICSFFVGGALPRSWFDAAKFPYASKTWERDGAVYLRLGIKRWKDKLPDMSKMIPIIMRKQISSDKNAKNVGRLIQETCVAETVHWFLCVAGFGCIPIWPGPGGFLFAILWVIPGNLPFILIQRYNRPRLKKLKSDLELFKKIAERKNSDESFDFDLQYGGRA